MDNLNEMKAVIIGAMGALTGLWGWFGWLVVGWIICMLLDWITGSAAAAKDGEWNSAAARAGIWHKAGMIVVVMVAAAADLLLSIVISQLPVMFEYPGMICPVVLAWYIVTELGSITENAVAMGAPVPSWLIHLLDMGKDAVDNAGNKLTGKDEKTGGGNNEVLKD